MRETVAYIAAATVAAAMIGTIARRGGPYFARPATVYDHVARERHPTIDDIRVCAAAAPLMPRGATVTIIKPSEKPNDDTTHADTAVGLLPYQRVVAPGSGVRAEYVITIRGPLDDRSYRLVQSFAEGSLYTLQK
ncbi:MAG TPA: hypothetical protein VF980_15255 [Thermoanaerobaculia bacterium]